ncbi:MAG: carbamoyl-phosphate synthase large subunit, partial [Cycloclasticus pugetii]
ESLQKALRGLGTGKNGLDPIVDLNEEGVDAILRREIQQPGADRIWYLADAFRKGFGLESIFEQTKIDRWFLIQIEDLLNEEAVLSNSELASIDNLTMYRLKRKGFSDARLAALLGAKESAVRAARHEMNIRPVYKRIDSCAGEFSSSTAYMYSTYEQECESQPSDREKIMVLGGGPNRIGQGIEFDYCCVHAALAMREDGYETIMVNCNPETVSTDFDTSDRLYFESLTLEDVLEVVHLEKPKGVIVQYGGQTPLKLAEDLEAAGVPIIGTSPEAIDLAEDRERFQQLVEKLGLLQPPNRTARNPEQAVLHAEEIGYPLVVRPSYVLGGRAMEIVYNEAELRTYMREAVSVSNDSPVLLDRFLDDAVEVDVDAIFDGKELLIGGIMEHIEQAGVHSGDSACSLPPFDLSQQVQDRMRVQAKDLARELGVVGLMNIQFAIKGDDIYILEVNPRASRSVPFVSKVTGYPLAKIAARCMAGQSLADQGTTQEIIPKYFSVKESVFPFVKFPNVDPLLGPEMKSTGEVMGVGDTFGEAFGKSQRAAGIELSNKDKVLFSVRDADKDKMINLAKVLVSRGKQILATKGTADALKAAGVECELVNKVNEGRPHIVDVVKNEPIQLIVNTTEGKQAILDSFSIRRESLQNKVTYCTTMAGAKATIDALADITVKEVRELHALQARH